MPTLEEVKSTLWPRATYSASLMVAGAVGKAKKAFGTYNSGKTLDYGAVTEFPLDGVVIFTPAGWVRYDPSSSRHRTLANSFSRVGAGWSFGNNSVHNHARKWFEDVYGREPNEMENFDLQYDGAWFNLLKSKAEAGVKEERPGEKPIDKPTDKPKEDKPKEEPKTDPKPDPTPTPTPTPTPIPVVPSNILSPLSIRVEELRTSLGLLPDSSIRSFLFIFFNSTTWPIIKPWAIEMLRAYRLWRKSLGDTRELPK